MHSEVQQTNPLWQRMFHQVAGGLREKQLPTVPGTHDARGVMHVQAQGRPAYSASRQPARRPGRPARPSAVPWRGLLFFPALLVFIGVLLFSTAALAFYVKQTVSFSTLH